MERVAIPETTRNYYFKLVHLCVLGGTRHCFLNEYYYELKHASRKEGQNLWLALEDLERIYSPEMTLEEKEKEIILTYQGRTIHLQKETDLARDGARELNLGAQVFEKDGVTYLPVTSIMAKLFDKYILGFWQEALKEFVDISNTPEPLSMIEGKRMQQVIHGKRKGTICGTYWFEKGRRLIPYRAYVPTYYNPEIPMPMVILTHGGSSPQSVEFSRADHRFEREAQKRGYILFGIDGYIESSFFGSLWPTSSTIGTFDMKTVDKKNPKGLSEEVIRLRKESEEACQEQIQNAFKLFHVQKNRVYMMGNSMGGVGTYYLASINPGMFRALAPCGGSINPEFVPLDTLKGIPICLFAGSEDENGLEPLEQAVAIMAQRGLDHTMYVTGGGWHSSGYQEAMEEIFDFFDRNN